MWILCRKGAPHSEHRHGNCVITSGSDSPRMDGEQPYGGMVIGLDLAAETINTWNCYLPNQFDKTFHVTSNEKHLKLENQS